MSNHDAYPDDFSQLSDEQLAELLAQENAADAAAALEESQVTYQHDETSGEYNFSVLDPQNYLQIERRDSDTAYVENFQVDEPYLRRGLARRMLEGAAVTLHDNGVQELTSNSWTPVAIKTIQNVFGEQAITVFDAEHPEQSSDPAFAMTATQAALSSQRAQEYNAAHPDAELPTLMGATIHLDQLDLHDTPRPEER